jgi:hypothetical protein
MHVLIVATCNKKVDSEHAMLILATCRNKKVDSEHAYVNISHVS